VTSAYHPVTPRPLRRDARQNRDRIVSVARLTFAELGLGASVEEIASRAGVGMGTLYRRFPTKDALVDAVFEENLAKMEAEAEAALRGSDAWAGLRAYLTHIVGMQASDRGLCEILGSQLRNERLLTRARDRIRPLVEDLIARSQQAGALRADVVYEDISVLLWTTGRVADATRDVEPTFWQRYLALLLDGLRAHNASPLSRPPLTAAQHQQAMRQFAERR
jgi:AcrR family transcriptional regulator